MDNPASDFVIIQLRTYQRGRQNVRQFRQLVTAGRVAFDLNTERAQFFDPGPDGRAGHSSFRSYLRSWQYDGGIGDQHLDQLVDLAIRRVRHRIRHLPSRNSILTLVRHLTYVESRAGRTSATAHLLTANKHSILVQQRTARTAGATSGTVSTKSD